MAHPSEGGIRRACVIGAGVMGTAIAAQIANSGTPVLLLDIPPKQDGAEGGALTREARAVQPDHR